VNNPVIAVAVILDNPKGSYYGAAVSAPVFTEVAQQVLEYLGVSHDIEVRTPRAGAKPAAPVMEDAGDHTGEIEALYNAANELPSDDPLRGGDKAVSDSPTQTVSNSGNAAAAQSTSSAMKPGGKQPAIAASAGNSPSQTGNPKQAPTSVVVDESGKLRVPSLIGLPVRKVIEQAATAGLEVRITGNGTVREQAPAAGTLVAPGTQIVVRCAR
jgi:cell division protein FtsI (penicillin-binding protein 3)